MKVLAVHPSCLMYSKIYLRLEPLGLELVAAAIRNAGHEVQLIDLQAETDRDYFRIIDQWQPDVIAFSCNYLANIPEILDLAKGTRAKLRNALIFVGGHSASFTAEQILEHGDGAIDCVLKGEGEPGVIALLDAARHDRNALHLVPGVTTMDGQGPRPGFVQSLDELMPARDLLRHRRRYFIGVLDPCASIEFSRGCPWDCVFCSAWTFYGRSYRVKSPEFAVEELSRIREEGVFLLDDVAFIQGEHGMKIGELIAQRGIKKQYYLETRGDVLLRNKEVFQFWKKLGLKYMFLGLEAIDEEGLKLFRKRISLSKNFEALEFARSLGITVALNIIADPSWDKERFRVAAGMVHGGAGSRERQREYAVSGDRELADRSAPAHHARLPVVRHPACRVADEAAAQRILRGPGRHAARPQHEASRVVRAQECAQARGSAPDSRPDELHQDALEV